MFFALDLSLLKCFHIWHCLAMSKNMLCFRQELISLDLNLIEVGTKAKIMKMLTEQILCNRCTLCTVESD